MGEFDEDYGPEEVSVRMAEKCRPDYEQMIQKEKDKKSLLKGLYSGVTAVVMSDLSTGLSKNKLKDLMGSIHVRMLLCDKKVMDLIETQEKYNGKD